MSKEEKTEPVPMTPQPNKDVQLIGMINKLVKKQQFLNMTVGEVNDALQTTIDMLMPLMSEKTTEIKELKAKVKELEDIIKVRNVNGQKELKK